MKKEIQVSFWKALFDWIAARLPGLLAAFGFGYKFGQRKVEELKTENAKISLELEKQRNEDEVSEKYDGRSSSDIIHDAIESSRREK